MSKELHIIREKLLGIVSDIDKVINVEDVSALAMIKFCLEKEKNSTFNADFADNMDKALKQYNKLTEGQMAGLIKHYNVAKRWRDY